MTNTTHAARVAPAADAPLTEQISSLVARETRAYLLGCVELDEPRSEGVVIRTLLEGAIERHRRIDQSEYVRRVAAGEAEIARRERERAAKIAAAKR